MTKAAKITLGIVGGLLAIGVIGNLAKTTPTSTAAAKAPAPEPSVVIKTVTAPAAPAPTVTVTVTAAAAPQAPPAAPAGDTINGDGTYLVGSDVKPGTYKTAGPGALGMCYWERDNSSDGSASSIIANDNLNGQGVVTIKASDKVFKTTGCQDWVKAS